MNADTLHHIYVPLNLYALIYTQSTAYIPPLNKLLKMSTFIETSGFKQCFNEDFTNTKTSTDMSPSLPASGGDLTGFESYQ